MNNQRLRNHRLAGLSFSLLLLMGVVSPVNADTEYGPIRSGESLSGIVNKNYIISPYDDAVIMQEILRLNPRAFINNNMSLIRTGVTLTLPSDATIRRSRGSNTSAVVNRTVSRPQVTSVVSDERLSQLRNERDQANLRLRRIESETTVQIESLKSQVATLEADKVRLNQQLSDGSVSLSQPSKSEQTTSELKEKEQKIVDLDSQIAELIQASEDLKRAHQVTIGDLEKSNKALQDKLAAQAQNVDRVASTDKQIAELQAQNQQKMAALLKSFDGNELALKDALVKNSQLQRQFDVEVGTLKRDVADGEAAIAKLSTEKSALSVELSEANLAIKNLSAEKASNQEDVISTIVPEVITSEKTISGEEPGALLSGPVTKQMLIKRLESPVAFPLWGLLLGAFALGFTTLMMLFTRSRKQIVHSAVPEVSTPVVEGSNLSTQEEALVFRASDPSIQDPDIETLRAPQKRDPSRVAILDPSMTAAVATVGLASTAIDRESSEVEEVVITPHVGSESQAVEEKFKLLIAEAYEDLGDSAAASQMLQEVNNEK